MKETGKEYLQELGLDPKGLSNELRRIAKGMSDTEPTEESGDA